MLLFAVPLAVELFAELFFPDAAGHGLDRQVDVHQSVRRRVRPAAGRSAIRRDPANWPVFFTLPELLRHDQRHVALGDPLAVQRPLAGAVVLTTPARTAFGVRRSIAALCTVGNDRNGATWVKGDGAGPSPAFQESGDESPHSKEFQVPFVGPCQAHSTSDITPASTNRPLRVPKFTRSLLA